MDGDLTAVRLGYFRNYLQPQGFAKLADEAVLAAVRAKAAAEEAAARKVLDEANALATALPSWCATPCAAWRGGCCPW